MERFLKLKERGTTVKIEFIAGMTTFFAMVYILMVNANMFANPFGDGSNPLGVSYGAIYIATAISAIVGTILAGFISNLPLAQASGMGLNAFFVYTVCIGFGLISYIVISVFCGDAKKVKGSSWVIAGLFIAMLLLTH
ncbi:MAG: hypothetical protein IKU34_00585 [Clostridia bacterium]|nr:hypothetical protein [Clostridia bacterium]